MAIKQVWITEFDAGLVSIAMESAIVEPEHMRLKVEEQEFPDKPTKRNPKRHTCNVGLLSIEDLQMLRDEITRYLNGEE
jgi:hypothetical protein